MGDTNSVDKDITEHVDTPELNDAVEFRPRSDSTKSVDLSTDEASIKKGPYQKIQDKTLADCAEALIGMQYFEIQCLFFYCYFVCLFIHLKSSIFFFFPHPPPPPKKKKKKKKKST